MPKSFQDLINDVHSRGTCQEYGGCGSFCSSAEYNVIGFPDPNEPPKFINMELNLKNCSIF